MPATPAVQRLTAIEGVCRALRRGVHPGWSHRAHFEARRKIVVGGQKVTVCFTLHVVPDGGGEGAFRSSVTVWPDGRRSTGASRSRWSPVLLRRGWYAACQQELEVWGYRGKWRPSPWGRFGDFWKRHSGSASLVAELAELDELKVEPWAAWGRRRTSG
jgi:hypothetical protein